MRLIEKLDMRPVGSQLKRWGLFFCPQCNQNVERRYQHGLIQKHCWCNKHGLTNTRRYRIFNKMKERCYSSNCERYSNYGGRGIYICDEWLNNFTEFYKWSSKNGYKDNLSIDRRDNNGNYTPKNCRWITMREQARNKSTNVLNMKSVRKIRKLWKFGLYNYKQIGDIFEVDPSLIRQTILNKIWKEIT